MMIVAGATVFGWFSLNKLELKLLPEITYPSVTVRTELPGASPEEVENLVSEPIEEMLGVINNLQQITSISTAGMSDVIIAFNWNTKMDRAMMDIREKLDRITLPDEAKKPQILRYNPETEPIMKLAITGDDPGKIRSAAEHEIAPRLETIEGVAAAQVIGGRETEISVEIDLPRLAKQGISIDTVAARLAQENINLPGGILQEGHARYLIRTINEFRSDADIGEIVIGSIRDTDIRLRDVASIRHTVRERTTITHVAGAESVSIHVFKEGDANIVEVARRVADLVNAKSEGTFSRTKGIRELLPEGASIEIISDQSVFISSAIREVQGNAVIGGLLAIVVLFFFLRNLPHTSIVAVSIPASIVVTLTALYFQGYSLNLMTLGGLALGIGMLVDNSIVVLENIFTRWDRDPTRLEAARAGAEEVSMAVTASTLTTIAVFFPLVFVSGIAGQIFGDLAATVSYSLIASLLVSLSVIPMMASFASVRPVDRVQPVWIRSRLAQFAAERRESGRSWVGLAPFIVRGVFDETVELIASEWRERVQRKLRGGGSLIRRVARIVLLPVHLVLFLLGVLLTATGRALLNIVYAAVQLTIRSTGALWRLVMLAMTPLLNLFDRSFDGARALYERLLNMSMRRPVPIVLGVFAMCAAIVWFVLPSLGLNVLPNMAQGEFVIEIKMPVGTSLEQTEAASRAIETLAGAVPGVDLVSAVIGSSASETFSEGVQRENLASISVRLDADHRTRDAEEAVMDTLRESLARVAGIEKATFLRPSIFSLKTPLEVELRGQQLNDLRLGAERLAERLRQEPYLRDVHTTLEEGYPEIHLVFDRVRLARLNLSPADVARGVKAMVEGVVATTVTEKDEELDIRVRSGRSGDLTVEDIARYVINPESDAPVTLGSVARIEEAVGPSEIRRVDQRRTAIVRADVGMDDLRRAFRSVEGILRSVPSPAGVTYVTSGQSDELEASVSSLATALALAIFLVYLVMASQFESLLQPLIILFSVPLGLCGVVFFLYLLDIPISIMVFIGMIVLVGIVVNNAILLIDAANRFIGEGAGVGEALRQAVARRIRPIFMTTLTTVLGLLPMAFDRGPGSEIRMPLAVTVILGLATSTFLTLIVIPLIYRITHRDRA